MTPARVSISIDGVALEVPAGANLAAVMLERNIACRTSIGGKPRAASCGMGLCGECRVTLGAERQVLACRELCIAGLKVSTHV